ncbi:MAG: hypothetical protein KKG33_04690 [candidate division Zixibacteria bacterium]|nr:hypothetical protein [candidate division Zixibacteria bacterium]MBU1471823.1 hypothetical protein [candidate division Zixibacteria bacterium]MBU2624839.1 hypothetical protein [candidate division Zixibacteria bacterium]
MFLRIIFVLLLLAVVNCSSEKTEQRDIVSSQYTLDISSFFDIDSLLAIRFNDIELDERIPRVESFRKVVTYPEILPSIQLLLPKYELARPPSPVSICYDKASGRFYAVFERTLAADFSTMIEGRFGESISGIQAFRIAAAAVHMAYNPRLLACRKADLFLDSRLRRYINDTYTPVPGKQPKEFTSDWWTWEAIPSANNDYRNLYNVFKDSISEASFLKDIPDGAVGVPTVEKQGLYYQVIIFGLPPGAAREVMRYKFRIAEDGRIHSLNADVVYYY